jgi:hypothetical protein
MAEKGVKGCVSAGRQVAKAVGQLAHLLTDPPSSDRGPYYRGLRRFPQVQRLYSYIIGATMLTTRSASPS